MSNLADSRRILHLTNVKRRCKIRKQQREDYELLKQRNSVCRYRMCCWNAQTVNDAKNFFESAQFERFQLPAATFCKLCRAKKFARELSGLCCTNGKVVLTEVSISEKLRNLFLRNDNIGIEFRKNICAYNSVFAFRSMGVKLDDELASGRNGVYCFCTQGEIYHTISDFLPGDHVFSSSTFMTLSMLMRTD